MLDMVVLGGLCALSGYFLMRLLLIKIGVFKTPVLHHLQSYSAQETYYPLPAFFVWMGLFSVTLGVMFMLMAKSGFPVFLPGIGLWLLGWASVQFPHYWMQHSGFLFPAWYRDLQDRAGRDEQRRIAYAWLRLSAATRRRLCFQERAFATWIDLVLLSTTDATADTFVYEATYRLLKRRMAAS
jgi:hypothetical protein